MYLISLLAYINILDKEKWKDEYLKWICGFANSQGGTIYIGKNDNGDVVGVDNAEKIAGGFTEQDKKFNWYSCRSESC